MKFKKFVKNDLLDHAWNVIVIFIMFVIIGNDMGVNFMGGTMVLGIWYIYERIYVNETNKIVKSLLLFGFLYFLNKLSEVPYFAENSIVITVIFLLELLKVFFIFNRKESHEFSPKLNRIRENKINLIEDFNQMNLVEDLNLEDLNSKKRRWKFVLYAMILSAVFGLFIKYEGGYTKQELQKEFITKYVDNYDGTVTHTKTGLVWQRCSVGQIWKNNTCEGDAQNFTLDEAIKLANKDDWRLPTNAELVNLVHCSDGNYNYNLSGKKYPGGKYLICATNVFGYAITVSPTINNVVFPYTPKDFFWSSTKAEGVGFYIGFNGALNRDTNGYIRLVRNVVHQTENKRD